MLFSLLVAIQVIDDFIASSAKHVSSAAIKYTPEEVKKVVVATVRQSFKSPDLAVNLIQPITRGIVTGVLEGNTLMAARVVGNAMAGGIEVFINNIGKAISRFFSRIKALVFVRDIPPTYLSRINEGIEAVSGSLNIIQELVYGSAVYTGQLVPVHNLEKSAKKVTTEFLENARLKTGKQSNIISVSFGKTVVEQFKLSPLAGFKISLSMLKIAIPMIFNHFMKSTEAFFTALYNLFKGYMTRSLAAVERLARTLYQDLRGASRNTLPLLPTHVATIQPDTIESKKLSTQILSALYDYRVIAASVAVIAASGGAGVAIAKNNN